MDAAAPTIPARKQVFLTAQTNLLSQPLVPSRSWREANDASNTPIPKRLVDDAVFNLNHAIEQHCRRVYAPQATRNIAEQINSIYTRDAERRAGGPDDVYDGIGKEVDLTNDEAINALPQSWPSESDANANPNEAERYADATLRLVELSQERRLLQLRVGKLHKLAASVEPLRTADGGAGIQENLATRNGPVEKELEKMRVLLARVTGRVDRLRNDDNDEEDAAAAHSKRRVNLEELQNARKRIVEDFLAGSGVFPK